MLTKAMIKSLSEAAEKESGKPNHKRRGAVMKLVRRIKSKKFKLCEVETIKGTRVNGSGVEALDIKINNKLIDHGSDFRDQHEFRKIGLEIGALVEKKDAAYGDSFGKSSRIMEILYSEGIPVDKYGDALTLVRIIDKMFRIATDRDALGEDPYADIAGYAIKAVERNRKRKGAKECGQ